MKKNLGIVVLTCFLLIGLASCMNGLDSSSIELSFDKSIFSSARNAEDNAKFLIAVTLSDGDGYDETQVLGENDISQSVVFKELPIGAHVEADVKVFQFSENDDSIFYSTIFYGGKADFIVDHGQNKVSMKLSNLFDAYENPIASYGDEFSECCKFYEGGYFCIMGMVEGSSYQCSVGLYTGDVSEPGNIYMMETAYRDYITGDGPGYYADSYTIIHNPEKRAVTIERDESWGKYFYFSSHCGNTFYCFQGI